MPHDKTTEVQRIKTLNLVLVYNPPREEGQQINKCMSIFNHMDGPDRPTFTLSGCQAHPDPISHHYSNSNEREGGRCLRKRCCRCNLLRKGNEGREREEEEEEVGEALF